MRRFFLIFGVGAILLTLNILAQQLTFEIIDRDKRTNTDEFLLDLKNDKYVNSEYNPVLKSSDISKLLKLASNTTKLTKFPTNPISSFAQKSVQLNTAALWLIEGIRKNHGEFDLTEIEKLPSLNILLLDNLNKPGFDKQAEYSAKAFALYNNWYRAAASPESFDWNLDPLSGSGLRWK